MATRKFLDLTGLRTYDEQIKAYIDGEIDVKQDKNLIVTLTRDSQTNTFTADATFEEITEAYNNGANVYVYSNGVMCNLDKINSTKAWFNGFQTSNMAAHNATISSDNVATYTVKNIVASYMYGGVKADAKSDTDTVPAKIGTDGKLYVPTYPSLDNYYTETEIDTKLSAVNTSISNITSGTTVVKKAEHATSADSAATADSATTAGSATKATQDGNGKVISSTYETKTDAAAKLTEAKSYADTVASSAATKVKNDLLNGAGTAYDTLKELGDLIDDNKDAIDALETVAAGKANATHTHAISDVSGLQSALDGKANASHGTHVEFDSTNKPKMDGTAAFGTSTKVARADHVHPTDTSRASKTEFDTHVADTVKHITSTERTNWGTAYTHSQAAHAPSDAQANQNAFSNVKVGTTTIAADTTTDTLELVGENVTITPDATNDKVTISVAAGSTSAAGILKLTDSVSSTSTTTAATPKNVKAAYDLANTAKTNAATAQTAADNAQTTANEAKSAAATNTQSISANTQSISAHTTRLTNLETKVGDGFEAITTAEIQALFTTA